MVLDSSIHARWQRGKRWNRIYSDGARGAGSLRGALTGNDARSASIIARSRACQPRGDGGQAPRIYQSISLEARRRRRLPTLRAQGQMLPSPKLRFWILPAAIHRPGDTKIEYWNIKSLLFWQERVFEKEICVLIDFVGHIVLA